MTKEELKQIDCVENIRVYKLNEIETNNSWIKIESGNDLPKIDFHTKYYFYDGENIWIDTISLDMRIENIKVTHYHPFVKPKTPLY